MLAVCKWLSMHRSLYNTVLCITKTEFILITEITNKLTPSTTDVIVLREQTTSSSSDSIFTDPLTTPIGFSTEINQCYYSEENVCDTSDVDKLDQLAGETVLRPSHSCSRKTKSYLDILNKLSKLSLTNVDCYTTVPDTVSFFFFFLFLLTFDLSCFCWSITYMCISHYNRSVWLFQLKLQTKTTFRVFIIASSR